MFEYVVPGDDRAGYCLASGRFLLAISGEMHPSVPRLWSAITAPDADFDAIFEVLADRGVSTMPAFAIAEIYDETARAVRVLVHGDAIAQVSGDQAARLSGAGLTTWQATSWQDIDGVMIGLGGVRSGIETLPITGGIVRAEWIRWRQSPRTTTPAPVELVPVIRVGDGSLLGLELPLVFGRHPAPGLTESGAPMVPVVVASPQVLISATHLLVERDGQAVRLRDLGAKNGSAVTLPDGTRIVLRDGASQTAPIGARIELGDGVDLDIVAQPTPEPAVD